MPKAEGLTSNLSLTWQSYQFYQELSGLLDLKSRTVDNDILDTLSLWIGLRALRILLTVSWCSFRFVSFTCSQQKKNLTRKICISERRKVISNLSFLHRLLRVASLRNLNRTRDIIGLCSGFQILFELFPLKHISSLV